MADIFVSYAHEDEARAHDLVVALELIGWSVWWDRLVPFGKEFRPYIQEQLNSARCIVVLWSQRAVASRFVRDEASEGLNDRVVPVLLEGVQQPLGFRELNAADLTDWRGQPSHDGFERLVVSIRGIVGPEPAREQFVVDRPSGLTESRSITVTLQGGAAADLAEYIFILPGNSDGCSFGLTNSGAAAQSISRIEMEARVFRRWGRNRDVRVVAKMFRLVADDDEVGLRWKTANDSRWVIDTPLGLGAGDTTVLPALNVDICPAPTTSRARGAARKLVGSADLVAVHTFAVWLSNGEITTTAIEVPVRILRPTGEDEDGGVDALVKHLGLTGDDARERRSAYQRVRRRTSSIQEALAAQLNEWREQEALESLADELEPLDEAIEAHPEDATLHTRRARLLLENGVYAEALTSLDSAIARGIETPTIREERLRTLQALGLGELAAAEAAHLLASDDRNLLAVTVLGRAKLADHEDEAALALFDRAIAIDASDADSHCGRGAALVELGREDEALAAFRRALELNPALAEAHLRSALALTERGKDGEVLQEIASALEHGYDDFDLVSQIEELLEPASREEFRPLLEKYES